MSSTPTSTSAFAGRDLISMRDYNREDLLALLDAGRLAAIPGNLAAYRRDGRVLKLPVEKRPPRWGDL